MGSRNQGWDAECIVSELGLRATGKFSLQLHTDYHQNDVMNTGGGVDGPTVEG